MNLEYIYQMTFFNDLGFGKKVLINVCQENRMALGCILKLFLSCAFFICLLDFRHVAIEWDVLTDRNIGMKQFCDDDIKYALHDFIVMFCC